MVKQVGNNYLIFFFQAEDGIRDGHVTGVQTVLFRSALTLRLRVRRGELAPLGWPTYGSRLHELIGEPNINRVHVRLMAYARSAIEEDPRVAEVSEVSARVLPGERDMVRLTMDIRLIDQPNPLNMVFDFDLEG